jgi:hypothetical protein
MLTNEFGSDAIANSEVAQIRSNTLKTCVAGLAAVVIMTILGFLEFRLGEEKAEWVEVRLVRLQSPVRYSPYCKVEFLYLPERKTADYSFSARCDKYLNGEEGMLWSRKGGITTFTRSWYEPVQLK